MRSKIVLRNLGIIIVLCAAIFVIVRNFYINHKYESFVNENLSISEYVTDRTCITDGNQFKIGNNEKELQSGYYDILIEDDEVTLKMYINKLWKTEFNDMLYEKEYVNQVADYLVSRISCSLDKEELIEILIKGYLVAKNGENYYKTIENKENMLMFQSENYELVIEVKSI